MEPLLADTPNSGHLPYNGQCAMYQLRFPYILYFKNLPIADTPNSGHLRIADSFSGTKALANRMAPVPKWLKPRAAKKLRAPPSAHTS